MELNSNEIKAILPHRYPFLLVDRVVEGEPGMWARGIKNVSQNEEYFNGHFPQEHIMPGVLIIEALAQLGAISILSMEENKGKLVYFAGIRSARFKRPVRPGDQLELFSSLERLVGRIGTALVEARVEGDLCAKAEITFAIGS